MRFDEQGRELPNPDPIEVPLDFKRPPTLQEQMARMIRVEMSRYAQDLGEESFDEADDFDVMEEEGMPFSPHELSPEQEALTKREFDDMLAARDKALKEKEDERRAKEVDRREAQGEEGVGRARRAGEAGEVVEESGSKIAVDDRGGKGASRES